REEEVDAAALRRVAGGREHRHEDPGPDHRRLEHDPELRQVPVGAERGVDEEEREARAQEPGQQDLAPEPALELVPVGTSHLPLVGRGVPADKGQEWPLGSSSSTTTPSPARRSRRSCAPTASTSSAAPPTAPRRSARSAGSSPISSSSTSRCPASTASRP